MAPKSTNLGARLRYGAVGFAVLWAIAAPAGAADSDLDRFKAEIDAFIGRLGPSSNGVISWAGSDPYDLRRDGGTLIAVISNVVLSLGGQADRLLVDRIEIRQMGEKEGGKLVELGLQLPREMTLKESDGTETKITLKAANASALIEARSGRGRESAVRIAGARLEQADTGAWVNIGPLSLSSKLGAEPNGGWSGPVDFEVKNIEYSLPQLPVAGGISRIAFTGRSAGPSLDGIEKLRDRLDRLRSADGQPHGAALLAALSSMTATPFSSVGGDFAMAGMTVRGVAGEVLASLTGAGITAGISGLDGATATLRSGIRLDGLELAPSVLEPAKAPRRVLFDLGVENISTEALARLFRAACLFAEAEGKDENGPKQREAIEQILGAAALLKPTFRVHDIALDTPDLAIDLTGEATGSPLAPTDYTAAGELSVRGFNNIPKLGPGLPLIEYLPVLQELGQLQTTPDGTGRTLFHLASAPPKWLTINGNDVTAWFSGPEASDGQARELKLADPPMHGADVERVQRALAAAKIAVDEDGIYSSGTAGAVARFQKQSGMNVSGIVDAATRERLGISAKPPRRGGRN